MILHAAETITDAGAIAPYVPEEIRITDELRCEGVIREAYRRRHEPGVFLVLEAEDVGDAERQLGRLPFVARGLLTFELVEIYAT